MLAFFRVLAYNIGQAEKKNAGGTIWLRRREPDPLNLIRLIPT